MHAAGQDATALIELARHSLVGAIHLGQSLVLVALIVSLLIAWRMPAMTLSATANQPAAGDDLVG